MVMIYNMSESYIAKKVLGEQIKEQLMETILKGELKPGDRLVEKVLARHYGVSHAPIREALKSLSVLHLVDLQPYKGAVVRKYTKEDLKEFFVVRSCLEGLAGRLAAVNCTQEDIQELQSILDVMILAAKEGNNAKRLEMNELFHKRLISASRNNLLIETTINLRLNGWSRVTGSHSQSDPEHLATRHKIFIELLKNHDAEGLEKAIIHHIEESYESFYVNTLPNYDE
jgi:DNA-binding GntR family transcriptional regulator